MTVPKPVKQPAEAGETVEFLAAPVFTERPAWTAIGEGWRHLHGSVRGAGVSFEWHDFKTHTEFDWGKSFHPGSVEVCLNLAGNGSVAFNGQEVAFAPLTVGFYRRGEQPLRASRQAEQRHQFLTVEMSFDFLRRHLGDFAPSLHPLVREVVAGQSEKSAVVTPTRLTSRQQQLLASLRDAPVLAAAQKLWYQTKALELAAELFFLAPGETGIVLPATAAAFRRARREGCGLAPEEPGKPAEPRGNRTRGRLQSVSFEPDVFGGDGHDDSAIPPPVAHGAGGGIAALGQIQRDGSRAGSGLFEPEPFQPGVSRNVRLLPGTLSAAHADAEDFA